MPAPKSVKPVRRDAVRNRALLVEAAATAFREDGLGVSVNRIAEAAGVNIATLYRHFATKDDLIAAVIEELFRPITEAGQAAVALPAGGDVLQTFLEGAVRVKVEGGGVLEALASQLVGEDVRAELRRLAETAAAPVVARAHAEGQLRGDFDVTDVLITLRMVTSTGPVEDFGKTVDRYLGVVLRGLRPD